VKVLCSDEAYEEVVVPSGGFALQTLRVLAWRYFEEILRHMFKLLIEKGMAGTLTSHMGRSKIRAARDVRVSFGRLCASRLDCLPH
jgi:hypothetical protein